jgi:hypothetical protein
MQFIDIRLDHSLLRETMRAVPEMRVEWVRNVSIDGDREILFWASGGAFDRFDSALDDDSTVTVAKAVDVGDQRLYQAAIAGEGAETDLFPVLVDVGGVVMSATVTHDGWRCEFGFPDRASVDRFFDVVAAHDVDYEIYRLSELEGARDGPEFGLTDAQRETLAAALERGYFDVPRQTTLEELGDDLGVSDTAVSHRLRRGVKGILEDVVDAGTDRTTST